MIFFSLKEGAHNLRNLGILGVLTLAALTLTLILIGMSLRGYFLIESWKQGLLGQFEIEAFLEPQVDSTMAAQIVDQVRSLPDIGDVQYVSKEAAARRFSEQFGEDIFELLEYNPLPTSIIVVLDPPRVTDSAESWEITARSLQLIDGIEDVVYQGNLLHEVNRFYARARRAAIMAVAIMLVISVVFTVLTVHSAIKSRVEFIRVVAFSGGTRGMARGPFIALGAYYGLLSAGAAIAGIEGLAWMIKLAWGIQTPAPIWWYPGLIGVGVLLATTGAGWAASRRIRMI